MFKKRLKSLESSLQNCIITNENGSALELEQGFIAASHLIRASQKNEGHVYAVGNGGSAGIASHFCNDLIKTLHIPSQTLYDSNLMTCLANDFGYEHVFSFPLRKLLKKPDLLVAISSSGKSQNILNAVDATKEASAAVITLSGFNPDNPLRQKGHINFWVDQCDYGLVEASHFFLLHTIIDLWSQLTLATLLKENVHV